MDELALDPNELAQILGTEEESVGVAQRRPLASTPSASKSPEKSPVTARPAQFAPLQSPGSVSSSTNLDLLLGVSLRAWR